MLSVLPSFLEARTFFLARTLAFSILFDAEIGGAGQFAGECFGRVLESRLVSILLAGRQPGEVLFFIIEFLLSFFGYTHPGAIGGEFGYFDRGVHVFFTQSLHGTGAQFVTASLLCGFGSPVTTFFSIYPSTKLFNFNSFVVIDIRYRNAWRRVWVERKLQTFWSFRYYLHQKNHQKNRLQPC